jgi:hypothetical protein
VWQVAQSTKSFSPFDTSAADALVQAAALAISSAAAHAAARE